jgi:gentisate 1,2-dioxygenase
MATRVESPYGQRARYYSSADGFNIKNPRVPPHLFTSERDRALDPRTPTSLIPLDLSPRLDLRFPATTPLILARYARIRAGDALCTRFAASGELGYVIQGSGETSWGSETLGWAEGDAFCLPGGLGVTHAAGASDVVLWIVTNEPEVAFGGFEPPTPGRAVVEPVHFAAEEIRRQLERIHALPPESALVGKAVTFSSAVLERRRTCLPSLTFAMNSLAPGESQRAHRHNAVAVTLVVQGHRCHSMVEGARVDWEQYSVMITPPGDSHSHHNDGEDLALFLIVQDGGLHYHLRTMGFSYT